MKEECKRRSGRSGREEWRGREGNEEGRGEDMKWMTLNFISIECDSIWSYDDRTVTSAGRGEILH